MRSLPRLFIVTVTLITIVPAAWSQEETVPARPRLLSSAAKKKAQQTGSVTEPVKRRPAGTFEFPQPEPEKEPEKAAKAADTAGDLKFSSDAAVATTPAHSTPLIPRPTAPLVDANGRIRGSSVADRMDGLRRRAVDADLSHSFLAAEPNELLEVEQHYPVTGQPHADGTAPADVQPEPQAIEGMDGVPTPAVTQGAEYPGQAFPLSTHAYANDDSAGPVAQDMQNLLIENAAPAISFQTVGPRKVVIGSEAVYRVVMTNSGKTDAENVIVTVKLPAWAEITNTGASTGTPQLDAVAGQPSVVEWSIPILVAGKQEFVTLHIVPRDSRPFDLAVGWTIAAGTSMTQIQVQEPKLDMVISGPDEVMYGNTEVFTITLSNPGSGDAENVVLSLLPVSAQQHMAGSREMGTLRAGERKSIDIELTAHQGGKILIKAMAYADAGLRTEAIQEVLVRRASMDVTVMGPPRNYAATTAIYRIRVENTGNANADNTVLLAAIPKDAVFLSCTDGGKLIPQHGRVQWQIGSMRPGAVRIMEMQIELHQPGENRIDVQCQAERDLSVARSFVTQVDALADLKLYVNDPQGAVAIGTDAVYEIRMVNRGTKAAQNMNVVAYFSEGIEPISIRGWRGAISVGQVTLDAIPTINPGQELSIYITARAQKPGDHVFRAELTCSSPETRLASEEWTKYYMAAPDESPAQIARQPEAPNGESGLSLQPLR